MVLPVFFILDIPTTEEVTSSITCAIAASVWYEYTASPEFIVPLWNFNPDSTFDTASSYSNGCWVNITRNCYKRWLSWRNSSDWDSKYWGDSKT